MIPIGLPKSKAISKLRDALTEIDNLKNRYDRHHPAFLQWKIDTRVTITAIYGAQAQALSQWDSIDYIPFGAQSPDRVRSAYSIGMEYARALLQGLLKEVQEYGEFVESSQVDQEIARSILRALDTQRRMDPANHELTARVDIQQLSADLGVDSSNYLHVAYRLLNQGKIAEHRIEQHLIQDGYAYITESGIQGLEVMSPIILNSAPVDNPRSNRVFVVHGHDEAVKATVARFLEHLGLQPLILHELPSGGRTIIEKIEYYGDAGFAVVLLTGDDMGSINGADSDQRPRARQNVVFELGYFVGRLGRGHVCPLYASGVELPSDLDGIVYVSIDRHDGWKLALARELRDAGYQFSEGKLLGP